MSAPNRTAQLNKLSKVLKKHYKPIAPPAGRSLLEHLIYACCLDNARVEAADEAFAKLQPPCYIDWNEVRVTSKTELAEEVTDKLPEPLVAAGQLKQALQNVFEAHFAFDIEFLRKQNLGKSEKDLATYAGGNAFVVAYVVQHALGGHAIPCCQGALDVLYIVGVISEAEHEKRIVPGLERAIPKSKGIEFGSLLHQLGADYFSAPHSPRVRELLLEVEPTSKDRFPKRTAAKKIEPPPKPAPPAKPALGPTAGSTHKKPLRPDAKATAKPERKPETKPPQKSAPLKSKEGRTEPTRAAAESRSSGIPRLAKKKPR